MSQPTYILFVDPDPLLQEMLESGFRLHNPDYSVLKADSPETALRLLPRYPVEVVVTEIEIPESRLGGAGFLRALEEHSPQLPIIVLTSAILEDFHSLARAAAIIPKPPDMDYLLRKVHLVVQETQESVLRGISLEGFLQVLEVEAKTCTLTVTSGPLIGHLYVHRGRLIHADTDRLESKAAAFAMLSWPDYTIKVLEKCDAEPTITERLNAILLEWCVQKDEGRHLGLSH